MRHVYENRQEAHTRGRRARDDIRAHHSPKRTASFIADRIATIRKTTVLATPRDIAAPQSRLRSSERPWSGPSVTSPWSREPVGGTVEVRSRGRVYRRVLRLLRPYTVRQRELEVAVVEAIRDVQHEAALELRDVDRRLHDGLQRQIERLGRLQTQNHEILQRLEEFDARLAETKQSSRPCTCLRTNASADDRSDRSYNGNTRTASMNNVYRGFEDLFRGSEDFIRHRQRFYLGLIRDRQPVLDVGCGRGNFSISSRSRESQRAGSISTPAWWITVERRAHDVELVEGNAYLEQQVDASFGAIFASQVIEHMPHEELMRFFGTARRKLALDGILIAETVNPHSIRAMKAFWVRSNTPNSDLSRSCSSPLLAPRLRLDANRVPEWNWNA
jgi:2-polyprenyl-3-methyl-5-hydroxy-6-metoxy-1,4-benzoquinol methylase